MIECAPEEIRTERLVLSPLEVGDATEMVVVLADPSLYSFIGGKPPTLEELTAQYVSQVAGSGSDDEVWYNWVIRLRESGTAVGFVQATVEPDEVDLAWVLGVDWQGNGFASEAATAMRSWLTECGLSRFRADVHPDHVTSQRVAAAIGLHPTAVLDEDGEEAWSSEPPESVEGSS